MLFAVAATVAFALSLVALIKVDDDDDDDDQSELWLKVALSLNAFTELCSSVTKPLAVSAVSSSRAMKPIA